MSFIVAFLQIPYGNCRQLSGAEYFQVATVSPIICQQVCVIESIYIFFHKVVYYTIYNYLIIIYSVFSSTRKKKL